MEIAYILFFIICIILFAIGFYNIGRRKTVQEKEINYQKEVKEKEKIELEIKNKQIQLEQIKSEYADKQKLISHSESLAEEVYRNKFALLEEKYENLEKEERRKYSDACEKLQNQYKEWIDKQNKEKEIICNELKSIQNTRAAAIKAFQLEEMDQEEKDNFRLDITSEELNDVQILETVRPRLNKPRILSMLIWQTFFQPLAKKKFPIILGNKEVCGIYKITNLINQKVYIGQAKDCRKRWLEHCKCGLGIDTPQANKLYQAMLKDGLENFTFELLEECDPSDLDQNEQYFIEMFNSIDWGYNSRKQIR